MRQRYSSLPLQVVIYFNGWYLALLYLAELALIAYKGKTWGWAKNGNKLVTMATSNNSYCLGGKMQTIHVRQNFSVVAGGEKEWGERAEG